jgi:hypothetical protein
VAPPPRPGAAGSAGQTPRARFSLGRAGPPTPRAARIALSRVQWVGSARRGSTCRLAAKSYSQLDRSRGRNPRCVRRTGRASSWYPGLPTHAGQAVFAALGS